MFSKSFQIHTKKIFLDLFRRNIVWLEESAGIFCILEYCFYIQLAFVFNLQEGFHIVSDHIDAFRYSFLQKDFFGSCSIVGKPLPYHASNLRSVQLRRHTNRFPYLVPLLGQLSLPLIGGW